MKKEKKNLDNVAMHNREFSSSSTEITLNGLVDTVKSDNIIDTLQSAIETIKRK